MLAEHHAAISTTERAPDYPPAMRITTAILPAFLLILTAANCHGDDMPENQPGDFGEPCTPGANDDTPDGCIAGLECYSGYCEEKCGVDADCREITGWMHMCVAGVCQILCEETETCPQDLGTPMACKPVGSTRICEADSA